MSGRSPGLESHRHGTETDCFPLPALIPSVLARDTTDDTRPNQSTFFNEDRALGFAFSVPEDNEDQFYFTLRVHRSHAWGAVGLGAEDMPGALYLMVYDNRDQSNVTFSPRLSYGYYEPAYHKDFEYEILEGSGIYDDHMVAMGRCLRNCLTWPHRGTNGGKIDVNSTSEKGIYALGPIEGFASNNPAESLKFHVQYGSFYMDMSKAHGATGPPVLTDTSISDGARLDQQYVRKADVMSTMHAVCMVLAIVLLMPLGAVMIRLGGWVKWHAYNQTVAMVLVLVGFGVGIATSYRYQRVSLRRPLNRARIWRSDPDSSLEVSTPTTRSWVTSLRFSSWASSCSASSTIGSTGRHRRRHCTARFISGWGD